ncbi:hypothetical protein [Marinobacter sp.]|uniref:hypothetical protein n=1 Tax=Marinobacter sp. TaxID=50741 RepID=UPI0025838855|nr:hypothetical protein [Marinobacter sp.]
MIRWRNIIVHGNSERLLVTGRTVAGFNTHIVGARCQTASRLQVIVGVVDLEARIVVIARSTTTTIGRGSV